MGDTPSSSSDKRALRRELLRRRAALPAAVRAEAARRAARALLHSRELKRARRIALYLAHGAELDPAPLMRALHRRGKRLYLPVVIDARRMIFVRAHPRPATRGSRLGVRQPRRHRPRLPVRRLHCLLLPLIGYDDRGTRLGRGGGYYDRALAGPECGLPRRIGYGYACQRVERLPREPWDRPLHAVAGERGLRRFGAGDRAG